MRNVWDYLKACFWAAVAIRQKARAVAGLLAAFLALPIVLALGGTLELAPKGIVWFAVWLTTSAALLVFVIAPFFLWLEGRTESAGKINPITFAEFAKIAEKDFGWDFVAGWEAGDLSDGVRLACRDELLAIDAKPNAEDISEYHRNSYLPVAIKSSDWHEKDLAIWAEDVTPLSQSDNWNIRITPRTVSYRERYRDPRITQRRDAVAWLRDHGPKFKGARKASSDLREERKRIRDEASDEADA